ncbi:hypothetical protein MTO96_021038 [Rhipicephalus appendiculatus]
MSRGDELGTVKAVIRALLIARTRPMRLRSFLSIFRESEGHELPFTRFGFTDPLSFLRDISDAVQVSQCGSDIYVTATATDDVEHVQRLVRGQRQRVPHFKSMRFPPAHERPALSAPFRSTAFSPSTQRDSLEQVKANLRVLLAEHLSNGINVRQLHETYTRRFGSQINYASIRLQKL